MHWLEWLDNRTLLASECLTVAVFSAFMLGLRAFYPNLNGITAISLGFLTSLPGVILLLTEGLTSTFVSLVVSSVFLFSSSACLNIGIYQFTRSQFLRSSSMLGHHQACAPRQPQRFLTLLIPVYFVGLLFILYFTQVHLKPLPVVLAMTFPLALTRFLMAWNLYVVAEGRRQILWFASTTAAFGIFAAARGIRSIFVPMPVNFLGHHTTDVPGLMIALVLLCIQGLFYMLLFASEVNQKIHDEAQLDYLTGVLNRRGIERALEAEVARAWRNGGELAVLLVDIDHFKPINDTFGHAAGDEALRRVVAAFLRTVRVYDRVGRLGGDEFLLLLPQTSRFKAIQIASRILETVREDSVETHFRTITLSIGATCCTRPEEAAAILGRADTALYRAKDRGRDRVCFQSQVPLDGIPDADDDSFLLTGTGGPGIP